MCAFSSFRSFFSPELRSTNEEKSPSAFGWSATNSGPGSLPPHQVINVTYCLIAYNFGLNTPSTNWSRL